MEITPEIVTAHGVLACNEINGVQGECAIIYFEFYNVGQLVEGHGDVKVEVKWEERDTPYGRTFVGRYFTGGPNGTIYFTMDGVEMSVQVVNGTTITGLPNDIPIDNPGAFGEWEAVEMNVSVSAPERIDKFCINQGLRYILTIEATGYPGPIIEITGADVIDIGGDQYQVDVCDSPETIIDIKASNGMNTVTESIILPTSCTPEASLMLLEGPTLKDDNYEYVVQATVKGYPIPTMEWTNATPLDEMDTTVTVRVPSGEWLYNFPTVYLKAVNSEGEAHASLKLPISSLIKDTGAGFSEVSGQVMICRAGNDPEEDDSWEMVDLYTTIPEQSFIRTGEGSEAWIGMSDMTSFHLKPDTTILISKRTEQESKLKLVAGNIWINFKAMMRGEDLQIEYNQAVAGIKGTTFECIETGEESILMVYDGSVEFTSTATGETVMVDAGYMLSATSEGLGPLEEIEQEDNTNIPNDNGSDGSSSFPMMYVAIVIVVVVIVVAIMATRKK
ncbi:MAG TPA: FecR family protein [Candidatus Methanofastidiosa archaeon]|nr:FecR family protein [Candidatus Methanofastidiosa archaeon]